MIQICILVLSLLLHFSCNQDSQVQTKQLSRIAKDPENVNNAYCGILYKNAFCRLAKTWGQIVKYLNNFNKYSTYCTRLKFFSLTLEGILVP